MRPRRGLDGANLRTASHTTGRARLQRGRIASCFGAEAMTVVAAGLHLNFCLAADPVRMLH